jgi:predicted Rossmann fold flavoprotein
MIVVIGGGPAGFFAAIAAREAVQGVPVVLLEKHQHVLRKVLVSGGGRCNVTHDCQDPKELVKRYPRGGRELIGPFHRFGPGDMVAWFTHRRVPIKTESDGRMFPVSDSSSTIVEALRAAARENGVDVRTRCGVTNMEFDPERPGFRLKLSDGTDLDCQKVLIATGGQTSGDGTGGLGLAASLGHGIEKPVPSLFTFKIQDSLLQNLAGVAVPDVAVTAKGGSLPKKGLTETGPVLVTHWGLSGPAVLRLSAWGARELADLDYKFSLTVDWCSPMAPSDLDDRLKQWADDNGRKQISHGPDLGVPRRLWDALLEKCGIPRESKWAELGKKSRVRLVEALKSTVFSVDGKSLNKEEFVTCGGVRLSEVNFKTMESRLVPGLFFAGEVLDIDGITGGFNFQQCWTTGYLAGRGMVEK